MTSKSARWRPTSICGAVAGAHLGLKQGEWFDLPVAALAKVLRVRDRAVRYALEELRDAGLIERRPNRGRNSPDTYRLVLDWHERADVLPYEAAEIMREGGVSVEKRAVKPKSQSGVKRKARKGAPDRQPSAARNEIRPGTECRSTRAVLPTSADTMPLGRIHQQVDSSSFSTKVSERDAVGGAPPTSCVRPTGYGFDDDLDIMPAAELAKMANAGLIERDGPDCPYRWVVQPVRVAAE